MGKRLERSILGAAGGGEKDAWQPFDIDISLGEVGVFIPHIIFIAKWD